MSILFCENFFVPADYASGIHPANVRALNHGLPAFAPGCGAARTDMAITERFLQKATKDAKIFRIRILRRNVVIVGASCSGQNHSGNAVSQNELMKVDQQSDRKC
jgi:hypothetical protein